MTERKDADPTEARFEVEFTKAMLLFVNDGLRFVPLDDHKPLPVQSRAEEEKLFSEQQIGAAVNSLKHTVIFYLQRLKGKEAAKCKFKISYLEAIVLENLTTNSLENAVELEIDLEVQPHIVAWRAEAHPERLLDGEPRKDSDKMTHEEARRRFEGRRGGGSTSGPSAGRGPSSTEEGR